MSIIISERFEKEVVLHFLRIVAKNLNNAPLILGIDGPSGGGKTFQCKTILKRLGVLPFELSAGQFESKDAGEPAELLRKTYVKACEYVEQAKGNMAAILIDDVDVAFGNWGTNTQYTVNTQNVIGELMHLADPDTYVEFDEEIYYNRIPIFMTGNDFSKLYPPLKRSGRMNTFYWNPSLQEKIDIVFYMFDFLTEQECEKLITYTNSMCNKLNIKEAPIAFYSELKVQLYDESIWNAYCTYKLNNFSMENLLHYVSQSNTQTKLSYSFLKEIISRKLYETQRSNQNHLYNINRKRQRRNRIGKHKN